MAMNKFKFTEKERENLFQMGREIDPDGTLGNLFQNEMEVDYDMVMAEINAINEYRRKIEKELNNYHYLIMFAANDKN